ncbi:Phage integrase family protein [Roseovarius azorensis]|uniref:Phage integrase family protein n=1 Tax=Roseovarius azorensis TaxID=1287727 RepID=A0A1H7X8U9_9RHOB|nr:tyrosine-type recombinase/integrase [Roseovarius azorensis]SEM29568.1 Phage integrase family protein [Roseovarius azorensis]
MEREFDRQTERVELLSMLTSSSGHRRTQLIEEYQRRSEAAFAPATLRNYKLTLRLFEKWCHETGRNPEPPVPSDTIAAWVDDMGGKIAFNTIGTRLWGIAELHRSRFLPSPTRHRLVALSLKGVKRKYGAMQKQAPPLGKKEVLKAIGSLGSSRRDLRDKALLWIATDTWCRASEIVAFRVKDLIRQDDDSSLLYVARSKTDQYGYGAYAFLSAKGTRDVLAWIAEAQLEATDPIITKSQKGGQHRPLDSVTVSRILKRCTGRKDVSAHSTRVGGVHDAFRLGCDLSSIMIAGRWASPEMPARYGKRILASQSAAAKVSQAFDVETAQDNGEEA